MIIVANKSNIRKHAQALLGNNYSPERAKQLEKEILTGFIRAECHISHDRAAHMERINKILGNHGTEGGIWDKEGNDCAGDCSMQRVKWDVHYSNTGDTYGLTVLYVNGKLYIGDWGSLFE